MRFLKSGSTGSRPFRWLMRANKPTTAGRKPEAAPPDFCLMYHACRMSANSREVFDRMVLALPGCVAIAAAVWALFYFGIVLQAGVVVIALALLWIGWELHSLVHDVRELMQGFLEGYQESITRAKR